HINVVKPLGALEAAQGRDVVFAPGYDPRTEQTDEAMLAEAVAAAKAAQVAVVFAGLPNSFETEGCDRETLDMPRNQNELIAAVAAANPNTVVVLHGGAPMLLPWLDQVKAVLCMHLGGQQVGGAVVKVLWGEQNPSGRLAESWPLSLEDTPAFLNFPGEEGVVEYHEKIYIGYRYYDKKKMNVLFPFGHGLSYAQFAYSDLRLDKEQLDDTQTLTVSCKVKNVGSVAGKEVVQLYIGDKLSTVSRPVRELHGFEKVELQPGEEKEVVFTLDKRAFAYYEPKIHDWFVESGEFTVEVGASSRDIRLCAQVCVNGTVEIPVTFGYSSIVGDLMKTAKGRAFVEGMMQKVMSGGAIEAEEGALKNMGEGAEKMFRHMMLEMPLQTIVSFGMMSQEQLDGLLAMLNS
ncbi:MAG: glycoside hydrolase family 3 C-terminal domain-containing protein, partial [Eubacteriales bacterium]|nr:glycoside hydrolase family 3 C-terminal domain-containing protein [Eubacteriales bacterium]